MQTCSVQVEGLMISDYKKPDYQHGDIPQHPGHLQVLPLNATDERLYHKKSATEVDALASFASI